MKTRILVLVVFTAFMACNDTKKPTTDDNIEQNTIQQAVSDNSTVEDTTENDAPSNVLLGTWTGEMSEKKLTIVIEKIEETKLVGYNILGTNKRLLKGTFTEGAWDQPCAKAYQVILNEPGDAKGDGVFTVKFVGYEDEEETEMGPECKGNLKGVEALGEWQSNKSKVKKKIQLVKETGNK